MTGGPRHITWRGTLRSCNYACTYCPFARKEAGPEEPALERKALERFAAGLVREEFQGSVLLAPYGEGLAHSFYQEGYAALSRLPGVLALSCQTNLSWNPDRFLRRMERFGADLSKAALWATMHPAMTTPEIFLGKCRALSPAVKLSVGMVGDPAVLPWMQAVRRGLPAGAHFWINAMHGLGRRYTPEEVAAFAQLDPQFPLELGQYASDGCCEGRFVDADRGKFRCNRSRRPLAPGREGDKRRKGCGGKCDCFLAYSGRRDIPGLLAHAPYPQLRLKGILPKAVILEEGSCRGAELELLRRHYRVYVRTALSGGAAEELCGGNGWKREEILVFSGAGLDEKLLRRYPVSVCPPGASPRLREAARFHMRCEELIGVLLELAAQ